MNYMKLVKITKGLLAVAAVIAAILGYVHYSYLPVRKGRIFLERANSTVVIVREAPYMIHHIYAESLEMAVCAGLCTCIGSPLANGKVEKAYCWAAERILRREGLRHGQILVERGLQKDG